MKKESKYNTKDSHQSQEKRTKEERGGKTHKNNPKTINKMTIRTYISIITLRVNRLNAPTKRMDTKIRPTYMLSTRDPLQT